MVPLTLFGPGGGAFDGTPFRSSPGELPLPILHLPPLATSEELFAFSEKKKEKNSSDFARPVHGSKMQRQSIIMVITLGRMIFVEW